MTRVLLLLSLRLAHVLEIVNVPASHIAIGLGLLTLRRKGTALSMSKFLPRKTLFIHFLILSLSHLETGSDLHLTCENSEDWQGGMIGKLMV